MNRRLFLKNSIFFINAFLTTNFLKAQSIDSKKSYEKRLYTPTFITKIDNLYFIVDCWHHRIIFSDDFNNEIKDWQILDDEIYGPHSIASNKKLYVVDNTGNNSLRVYRKISRKEFEIVQNIDDLGMRPHRVIYNDQNQLFYVLISGKYGKKSSNLNNFYALKEKNGLLKIVYETQIEELKNTYTRSITISKDNFIYFVSENSLLITKFENLKIYVVKKINLHESLSGSNDLFFLNKKKLIMTFTNNIGGPKAIVTENLSNLEKGKYRDISENFIGVPYYIDQFDNYLWIPEIKNRNRIVRYIYEKGILKLDKVVFDFQSAKNIDIERKNLYPL